MGYRKWRILEPNGCEGRYFAEQPSVWINAHVSCEVPWTALRAFPIQWQSKWNGMKIIIKESWEYEWICCQCLVQPCRFRKTSTYVAHHTKSQAQLNQYNGVVKCVCKIWRIGRLWSEISSYFDRANIYNSKRHTIYTTIYIAFISMEGFIWIYLRSCISENSTTNHFPTFFCILL